jgi:hypothetical protein
MKTERDKMVAKARKICADPKVEAEWRTSWDRVINHIEPLLRAGTKVFEAHHTFQTAREAFLRAAVAGKSMDDCERAGIDAVCPAPAPAAAS